MELGLRGRVAVVTGASRGIGLAVVRALAAEEVRVVAGARHATKELVDSGAAEIVEVDLATPDGPAELVARAGDRIDLVVNNVGGAPPRTGGFLTITDEDWATSHTLNLMAAVRTIRAALPVMLARGQGSIVNIVSVNARIPEPLVLDYSAAKAGLAAFSKGLSKEVGPHGIRVNTVSPGPVATDLWLGADGVAATVGQATGTAPEDVAKGARSAMVTGRFTEPAEVAALVLMLAGDRAANITGADFTIDGGYLPTWA